MSGAMINLAHGLGRHLTQIMPEACADWAMGMKAEIEAIDDPGAALMFALGCVRVGYARRLRTVSGTLTALRWSVAGVTLMFSVFVLDSARRALALQSPETLPLVIGGLGLAFLIAGLALARFGPRALAVVAGVMLAFNTVWLHMIGQGAVMDDAVYRALIVEGYALWSALLLAGLVLYYAARSTRLAALACDHGWDS